MRINTDIKLVKETKQKIQNQDGMTLIDVAVALLVIGILIAPVFYALKQYRQNRAIELTTTHIQNVDNAIVAYFSEQSFYPCPADPTLSRDDVNAGVGSITAGACDRLEGAIPYQTLGINVDNAYDGWGNKLLYAVTQAMTVAPFVVAPPGLATPGDITVQRVRRVPHPTNLAPITGNCVTVCANSLATYPPASAPTCDATYTYPATVLEPNTGIHYTILSHGQDGVGAFNERNAAPTTACVPGATPDSENCNGDRIFTIEPQNGSCLFSDVNTAFRYDDIAVNQANNKTTAPANLFNRSSGNPDSLGTQTSFTGINNDDPQFEVDIRGNITLTDADGDPMDDKEAFTRSDEYCNTDGSLCFEAGLIGGDTATMQCAGSGGGLDGIGSNEAKCTVKVSPPAAATTCPSGQYVISISATGVVTCG